MKSKINVVQVSGLFLVFAIVSTTAVSIFSRSTLHKIGLSLLTVGAVAASSKLQTNQLDAVEKELEKTRKILKAEIAQKDLEIKFAKEEIEELKQRHEDAVVDLQQKQRQEIGRLGAENHSAFESKISLINKKHALSIKKLTEQHEQEIRASDTYIQEQLAIKTRLETNAITLQKEFESLRDDYAQKCHTLEKERADLDSARERLHLEERESLLKRKEIDAAANAQLFQSSKREAESIDEAWRKYHAKVQEFDKRVINTQHAVREIQKENELLKQQLAAHQKAIRQNNGRFNLTTLEGRCAHTIEQFFARQELPVTYVHGEERRTQDTLFLRFTAKEDNKDKIVKKAEALSLDCFAGQAVNINRKDGYLMFSIPIEERVDLAAIQTPDKQEQDHLTTLVQNSNHFLIMGATGDGKSALTSNLLELAGNVLGNPEVLFLNPKPTGVDFWFRGKKLRADYMNFETPAGCLTPDCAEGLNYINEVLTQRMAAAQSVEEKNANRNDDNQLPFPNFSPLLIVIDECQQLRAESKEYSELFTRVTQKLAHLGREYRMIAVMLGQGVVCASWGFRERAMFTNFTRVYFASSLTLPNVQKQEIKELPNATEVANMIESFQSKRSEDKTNPFNFYALFIQQGNAPGRVAYLPKPNYFHSEHQEPVVSCPSCHSTNTIKNGVKDDKQVHKCKDCGTQFRGEIIDVAPTKEPVPAG